MDTTAPYPAVLMPRGDRTTPARIARSAARTEGPFADSKAVLRWFDGLRHAQAASVTVRSLDDLPGWETDPNTGDIRHRSGNFFTVEGVHVRMPKGSITSWSQPIINQREIGILGILTKEFDGTLHFLMQAKMEPGNPNRVQLSPTVQATRSNYTRVHGGRVVPYLDYFQDTRRHRIMVDVRQAEQGSWFRHKRNRNMIVEVTGEVPVLPGFHWLTLGQVHRLLGRDDTVNMDARTVLSCLPFSAGGPLWSIPERDTGFQAALLRSCSDEEGSVHSTGELLNWMTDSRVNAGVEVRTAPLRGLPGWIRTDQKMCHETGVFFEVIGVRVRTRGREVDEWSQPMLRPCGTGVIAFLVARIGGVLHALVHARSEPGYVDSVELAPTVQCAPETYDRLPGVPRPRFLDEVLAADIGRIRYDTTMSEEGGRFYDARNRYVIVEGPPRPEPPGFRWMTVGQLVELIRHSYYVNVQARSLTACLHSLCAGAAEE